MGFIELIFFACNDDRWEKNLMFFLWHLKRLVLSNIVNVKRGICHKNKFDDILWNCNFFEKNKQLVENKFDIYA